MKMFLKLCACALLILVTIFILSVLTLLQWPEILLNQKNLERLSSLLQGTENHISWKDDQITVRSDSLLKKDIRVHFKDLCLNFTDPKIKGCFTDLDFGVTLQLGKPTQILRVSTLTIKSTDFKYRIGNPGNSTSSSSFGSWISAKSLSLGIVQVSLKNFEILDGADTYSMAIFLDSDPHISGMNLKANLKKDSLTANAALSIKSFDNNLISPFLIDGPITLHIDENTAIRSQVHLKILGAEEQNYNIKVSLISKKNFFEGTLKGFFNDEVVTANAEGKMKVSKLPISTNNCHLKFIFDKTSTFDCEGVLESNSNPDPKMQTLSSMKGLRLKIESKFRTAFPPNPDNKWSGDAHLNIPTYALGGANKQGSAADLTGDVFTTFDNMSFTKDFKEHLKVRGNLSFKIADFGLLAKRLKGTNLLPPAPLNVLKGTVEASTEAYLFAEKLNIPFTLVTRLNSQDQILNLNAAGAFTYIMAEKNAVPALKVDVTLSDVQLILPRLGLKKPPALIPDSRIRKIVYKKKSQSLSYLITLKTPDNHPVRFISELSTQAIPFYPQLQVGMHVPLKGVVEFREFPLKLFRRDAKVNFIKMEFKDPDKTLVTGELTVKYTDYAIKIHISNTVEAPVLKFESEPPLPENQVLSVLLFGKPMDQLDSDQTSSVGNTQSAVADKALTLSSLYLLASTPVESVGYDSEKQTYTAKIRLQEGLSLDIGSDSSSLKEVGANKKLSKSLLIHTYLNDPLELEDRSITALLEWFYRY